MVNFYDTVLSVIEQDKRFFSQEGTLLRNRVYEAAMNMDVGLLHLLLNNVETK
jgi:adenine-specific DNA-methyltransferase